MLRTGIMRLTDLDLCRAGNSRKYQDGYELCCCMPYTHSATLEMLKRIFEPMSVELKLERTHDPA